MDPGHILPGALEVARDPPGGVPGQEISRGARSTFREAGRGGATELDATELGASPVPTAPATGTSLIGSRHASLCSVIVIQYHRAIAIPIRYANTLFSRALQAG